MSKYIRKPVEVDACQWFPPGHEKHDPVGTPAWKGKESIKYGEMWWNEPWGCWMFYRSGDGSQRIYDGWWIVNDAGVYTVLSPEQFAAEYEEATP